MRPRNLRTVVATLLLMSCVLAAPKPGPEGDPKPPPPLDAATWWARNRALLIAPAADRGSLLGQAHLRRLWLGQLEGTNVGPALLRLGRASDRRDFYTLVDQIRNGGEPAVAAVLALGLYRPASGIGHLQGLLADSAVGRHLTGKRRVPVPDGLRVAAGIALGLQGELRSYQVLRERLGQNDSSVVQAAVLIGLSFSDEEKDAILFEEALKKRTARPFFREVAATALGRHRASSDRSNRLLCDLLQREPEAAGRGVAIAYWFQPAGAASAGELDGLRRAGLASTDSTTRALSLVALASRGDASARDALDSALRERDELPEFAIIALGLLARAEGSQRDWSLQRLRKESWKHPESARFARELLAERRAPVRREWGRSLGHLTALNATFRGDATLEAILDLAVRAGS